MTTTTKKAGRVREKSRSTAKAEIRVRIDPKVKNKAEKIFKRLGLTTSDGVRLLLDQVLAENDIPHIPNAETREAIEECRAGGGIIVTLDDIERQWNEA